MQMSFQIGKSGVTEGAIESLKLGFKTHKAIRISVLKNFSPSKEKVKAVADELVNKLEGDYKYTLVGFTIILKKKSKV